MSGTETRRIAEYDEGCMSMDIGVSHARGDRFYAIEVTTQCESPMVPHSSTELSVRLTREGVYKLMECLTDMVYYGIPMLFVEEYENRRVLCGGQDD